MTVNEQQRRALAFIAKGIRAERNLSSWHEAGTVAALAKVEGRDLAAVTSAVARAAADPKANTPGVIPTAGPHWLEQLADLPHVRNWLEPDRRCHVCSQGQHPVTNHPYESVTNYKRRRAVIDTTATVAAIKAEVKPMTTAELDQPTTTPHPAADAARQAMKENES